MRFSQGPPRGAPPGGDRPRDPVYAVGRRVKVACPGTERAHVTLTDENGVAVIGDLTDGTEVEILGWRPRGATGARYRVRATPDGVEGWLSVGNLRRPGGKPGAAVAAPPAEPVIARAARPRETGRRFGQRK